MRPSTLSHHARADFGVGVVERGLAAEGVLGGFEPAYASL
jgi:hypothetical protein